MRELRLHIKFMILSLLIMFSCGSSRTVFDSSKITFIENLATINNVYDGDISLEELRQVSRFTIIPGLSIERILSYTISCFDNELTEINIKSDSITNEAKDFIFKHNELGDKFYINDIVVKYQNSNIDTLNSISIRLVKTPKDKHPIDKKSIDVRASIDSTLFIQSMNEVKITLNQTDFRLTKFSCVLPNCDNFWREYSCSGDTLPSDIIDRIKNCDRGKTIIFEDIMIVDKSDNLTKIPIIFMKVEQ